MAYSEQQPGHTESLEIISKMIKSAKQDLEDNSFHYLLWGWLVFLASAIHFVLLELNFTHNYLAWVILMPAGGIISAIYGYRQEKKQRVKTYTDDVFKYVLISFMVALITVLAFMSKLGEMTYPLVMIIYGIWLFTSGGIIKFRPLIYGGIVNWVIGIISAFITFEFQLMALALAVLLGYIIPGYMLKSKFNNSKLNTATV
jgi:hypothetical protein